MFHIFFIKLGITFSNKLLSIAETLFCPFPLLLSCCGFVVDSVVAITAINRGHHHPVPEVDQKLQAGGPGAQHKMRQQAGDQASWPPRPLKPTSDRS